MAAVADDDSESRTIRKMMAAEEVNVSRTSSAAQSEAGSRREKHNSGKDDRSEDDHCIKLKCQFIARRRQNICL
ncbi:hypothetical protein CEXT_573001 [Caerostris extrusa]|uniref:Uncharacterized protein n=1 Tax=Caerostris extrusa TaxID=172846 RepID=A0AAV4XXH9_CAEEX|nr:hypothetical protein CEXT_573001 [Caerostris extrusa]